MGRRKSKKIVIKIGTAIITSHSRLNRLWIRKKVREIVQLMHSGKQIILVSSGAVAAGMEVEGIRERPSDPLHLQLLSGKGQIRLMKIYKDLFKKHGIQIAQILLTHHNFSSRDETKNIKAVINTYLYSGTLPVLNTNDIITNEELMMNSLIKFTDNDELAALVARHLSADLLLILTDVEGLYPANPRSQPEVRVIERIARISRNILQMATREGSIMGMGGMLSKVRAAQYVKKYGIPTIIGQGEHSIQDLLSNKIKRSFFPAGHK